MPTEKVLVTREKLDNLANAISDKSGEPVPMTIDEMIDAVEGISGGGSEVEEKDVCFWDYDGTLVATYSAVEFANLTNTPNNPSHEGLIAEGWNWSLEDAKTYVADYGCIDIGQMYRTASGKTEVDITIPDVNFKLYMFLSKYSFGTITVDWGDNSPIETYTSETYLYLPHVYSLAGNYTIMIDGLNNSTYRLRGSTSSCGFMQDAAVFSSGTRAANCVTAIRMGVRGECQTGAFYKCSNIRYVTLYSTDDYSYSLSEGVFSRCTSLKHVTIPNGVYDLQSYTFQNSGIQSVSLPVSSRFTNNRTGLFSDCRSLKRCCIPPDSLVLPGAIFSGCRALKKVVIPNSITTFSGGSWFTYCDSLTELHLPNSITTISAGQGFAYSGIYKTNIPTGLSSLPASMFDYCYSLHKLTIPDNFTSIPSNFWYNVIYIEELHMQATTPPIVQTSSFSTFVSGVSTIYVPYSADHSVLEAYKTADNWSSWASYMVEEEPE